ncbi:restriction endonuclease subunit S [Stutzerimonas urumqiensis]|uniref:restriction endonuclease subunit S n=1 Tax=Stutzerimonas urumqiensis TaxID=638269 RepID=UPI003DA44E2F
MSWPLAKLDNHVDILSGFAFKSENFNDRGEGLPLVRIRDVVPGVSDTYYSGEYSSEFLLSDGDLLIGMDGDFNRARWNGGQALLNQRVCKVTAKGESLDQGYLYHFLPKALDKIHAETPAVTVKHLSVKGIRAIEIPLPPLPEQKRIAAILDKADAIRRKRQQAIQLADDFLRAVFLDMFGDPGANPKGFNEVVLGELTTGKTNNGLFRKNDEYGGSVPVAWVGELFRGNKISFSEDANRIDPTEKEIDTYGLKYGDLLFCRSSLKLEGIGFNNIYLGDDDNALFECHLIRMSPCLEKVNPVFLNYQLRMPSVRARIFQQAKTSTMTTIDQAGLSRIKVFVPPLDLQEEFERKLIKVESLYSRLYKNKSLDELVFSSTSQKAFSGQL